jgi:peptidoglycan-N-acetylglucosamine deacetylase
MSGLRVDMPEDGAVTCSGEVPPRGIDLSERSSKDQEVPRTRVASLLLAAAALTALGTELPEHLRPATPFPGARAEAAVPDPHPERRPTPAIGTRTPASPGPAIPGPAIPGPATPGPATPGPVRRGDSVAGSENPGPQPTGSNKAAPTVALTFDDGPSPYTPKILAVLRRQHVPATFCMVGDEARRYPAYAQMVVRDGHQLCNHSQNHADMTRLAPAKARREVVAAEREIRDAAGVAPRLFRFPYGAASRTARTAVDGYGLHPLFWDVDPQDWTRPSAATITRRILADVRPGSVVLMHDGGGDRSHTAASLDATITALKKRGYHFVLADVVQLGE